MYRPGFQDDDYPIRVTPRPAKPSDDINPNPFQPVIDVTGGARKRQRLKR